MIYTGQVKSVVEQALEYQRYRSRVALAGDPRHFSVKCAKKGVQILHFRLKITERKQCTWDIPNGDLSFHQYFLEKVQESAGKFSSFDLKNHRNRPK